MKIKDFIMKDAKYGNGLIIKWHDKLLFAIGKKDFWKKDNGRTIVTYTAVGGNLEQGESFIESSHREALEELGTDIEIISSDNTILFNFESRKKKYINLEEKIKPAIIYYKILQSQDKLSVCTYLAQLKGNPKPSMEVPALLLLKENQLLKNNTLSELLKNGAEIIEQTNIPRNSTMKPFGSAEILRELNTKERENILRF